MDPRVKILILVLFDALIVAKEVLLLHVFLFSLLIFLAFSLQRRKFAGFLKGFLPMVLTVFVIGYLFISPADAILLSLRFSELIVASYIFFALTDAEEISKALLSMKVPYNFVFIFTSAIRYVELVKVKFREIREAQMGRGLEVKLRNFQAILVPLIVGIFVLADELAEALESRGFTCKDRSFFEPPGWKFRDTVYTLLVIGVFLALFLTI